jgi:hypothetical protein
MTKTPFEIRTELLNMARDRLSQEYYTELEAKKALDDPDLLKQFIKEKKFPNAQDVITEAQLLNEFVSGNDRK